MRWMTSVGTRAAALALCPMLAASLAACATTSSGQAEPADAGAGGQAAATAGAGAGGQAAGDASSIQLGQQEAEALLGMALDGTSFNNVTFAFLDSSQVTGPDGADVVENTTVDGQVDVNGQAPRRHLSCSFASTDADTVQWEEFQNGDSLVVAVGGTATQAAPEDVGITGVSNLDVACLDVATLRELADRAQAVAGEQTGSQTVIEMTVDLNDLVELGIMNIAEGAVDAGASHALVDVMTDISNHVTGVRYAAEVVYAGGGMQTRELSASYQGYGSTVVADSPGTVSLDEFKAALESQQPQATAGEQQPQATAGEQQPPAQTTA